ncbi:MULTISPECIES: LysE/ArgO family amino acid transporter [unclassified Thalassolituus]|uniref:LysE/ArgO family amino acid transporter n=1 Tax=unclassified Thalassolituus TaxID=2624967 RepID=UPI0025E3FA38|nr:MULTISPECIES: LysE family transporter [unclassified Thalassolituus]
MNVLTGDLLNTFSQLLAGFLLTAGLIVSIGAQNAWVLNKCLRNDNPWAVTSVCIAIDATLIFAGVFLMDKIQQQLPLLVPVFTLLAIGILTWMGLKALQRAINNNSDGLLASAGHITRSGWHAAGQAAMISLFNPHVYVDTMALIGSVGARQASPAVFAAGASLASFCWFTMMAMGAKKLRHLLSSPAHWRVFDGLMAAVMFLVATSLVFDVLLP